MNLIWKISPKSFNHSTYPPWNKQLELENGWLEYYVASFCDGLFSGNFWVSGRVDLLEEVRFNFQTSSDCRDYLNPPEEPPPESFLERLVHGCRRSEFGRFPTQSGKLAWKSCGRKVREWIYLPTPTKNLEESSTKVSKESFSAQGTPVAQNGRTNFKSGELVYWCTLRPGKKGRLSGRRILRDVS